MKKTLPLLFALITIFAFKQASAQTNFVPGYIVKLNGDTVRGQLDDRNWNINPTKITFKTDTEQQFTVNDLLGFGSENDTYKRFKTDLLLRGNKFVDVGNYDVPVLKNDTLLFLRLLVKSDYDLYVLRDKYDSDHFYVIQDNNAFELIYKKQMINRGGALFFGEENTFKDQLIALLHAENTLKRKINGAKYTSGDLIAIFDAYNGNNNKPISSANNPPRDKVAFDFDVIAGMSYSYPAIRGWDVSFSSSLKPSFGLGITAYLTRNRKQFSIDNQLIYTSYSSESRDIQDPTKKSEISLKADYIKLITLVRYQYPKGIIRPYLGVGISNGTALNIETMNNVKSRPFLIETRKYEQALVFLLGASYKRFKFEFRNDYSNGISPFITIRTTATYYQFSLRYAIAGR